MGDKPPIPANEIERLASLRDLVVLDSEPEPLFDDIARLASEVCGAPIALISLVDVERQWFKANVGLPGVNETPRDVAFCAHTIMHDATLEVSDAALDGRFAGNPLVRGDPHIRFYAGAPLRLPHGERVGTLCVIDHQPRRLEEAQARMLRSLASIASQALVMRRNLINKSLSIRTEYERALAESEARYRNIVEDQSELISLADADGRLVYVNPACARHYGRVPDEMVGRSLFEFVNAADRDAVRAQVARVLGTGQAESGENRTVAADGTEKWVAWTNQPQRDARLRPMLHSVGRDITQRKLADEALRESRAFLYRTGRAAGVGGWELEIASGALTWSDETRRIHEVGPLYLPTIEGGISFYPPQARPVIQAAVQAGMENGQPWDLELPFVTATGRSIWVRVVAEVEVENGRPLRLVGAFQDITQRKQLEQRIVDNERFLRQLTDNLPLRIAYMDRDARYRFVNQAQCTRFGLEREQILGRSRGELTRGADDAVEIPLVSAVLSGQSQRFEYDEATGGIQRRFESRLNPDISDSGEVRGFFSTGIDITERSNAERASRELVAIFENSTDYVVQTDWRGNIRYMNPAVRRLVGLEADAPVAQRSFADFNTPATNRIFSDVVLPAVKAGGVWVGQTTVCGQGQREVPVSHMVIAHRGPDGRIDRYSAVMRDISVELRAAQQQQRHDATLRSVMEAIPDQISLIGADCRFRFANAGFERWSGWQRSDIIGRGMAEVLGEVQFERSRPWVERALRGEAVSFEKAYPERDTTRYLLITFIPLWLETGVVDGFVAVAQDLTRRKQEELRLLQLTQRDPLTALLNRAGFEEHLERQLREGDPASVALLYIDLDHFKPVNDQYGHPVGDGVLQIFAQRLQRLVRPNDAIARLGGDEFAIVLSNVRVPADAQGVADKVIAAANAPFGIDSHQLQIGASIGIAIGVDPAAGWRELVARADARLYEAKAAGRGRQAGGPRGAA